MKCIDGGLLSYGLVVEGDGDDWIDGIDLVRMMCIIRV